MQVETYEVTEVSEKGVECDAEIIKLIDELDLTGQQKLVRKDADGAQKVCPYRKMTKLEASVYKLLCPTHTKVRDFADEIIPLRVLQVIAHARQIFTHVEIWHPANADFKDPLAIGVNKTGDYSYQYFILARWGDVLEPFDKLKEMALKMYRERCASEAQDLKAKIEAKLHIGFTETDLLESKSFDSKYSF